MALKHVRSAGANDVASYQLAGVPYVTSSVGNEVTATAVSHKFPRVTRWVVIHNLSTSPMRVGFTKHGVDASVTANYLVLSGNQTTDRLELRCKELWFRRAGSVNCGFSIIAGLTGIYTDQFPVLTGSNEFKGVG